MMIVDKLPLQSRDPIFIQDKGSNRCVLEGTISSKSKMCEYGILKTNPEKKGKMNNLEEERKRVESIGNDSRYGVGINGTITKFAFSKVAPYLSGQILELGPAEGLMTELIVKYGFLPELVEGSETLCANLSRKFPQLTINHSLFEEYNTDNKFDLIIMGHVLEHVENPEEILRKYSDYLKPDGFIWVAVPNANSIHRQVAVEMGLLGSVYDLNEADRQHGHRRVFDTKLLNDVFLAADLTNEITSGYWLKPLSNAQIEATWTPTMIDAFARMGSKYPEIAGEIIAVAKKRTKEK